jgi:hypothetical protein
MLLPIEPPSPFSPSPTNGEGNERKENDSSPITGEDIEEEDCFFFSHNERGYGRKG